MSFSPEVSFSTKFQHAMVNILKFPTLVACQKGKTNSADPDQTDSKEARVLPKKHSDQGLPCLLF